MFLNKATSATNFSSKRLSLYALYTKGMLFFIPFLGLVIYNLQLAEENYYNSPIKLKLEFDLWFCINYIFWCAALAFFYPVRFHRPSDIFPILYIPICCLLGAVYWDITDLINKQDSLLLLLLMLLPIFAYPLLDELVSR